MTKNKKQNQKKAAAGGGSATAMPTKEEQEQRKQVSSAADSPATSRSGEAATTNAADDNVSSAANSLRDESMTTTTTTSATAAAAPAAATKTTSSTDLATNSTTTTASNANGAVKQNGNSTVDAGSSRNGSRTTKQQLQTAASTPSSSSTDPSRGVTSGAFAAQLIAQQAKRLHKLQADVIDNKDLEPLHALRVSMRQLRTSLKQFGSAIVITDDINDYMKSVWEATTECRDIDVMEARLVSYLPKLPKNEEKQLNKALKQLKDDREKSFKALTDGLYSGSFRKLMRALGDWLEAPQFTPLGTQPIRPYLFEWSEGLREVFLHDGWYAADSKVVALHELRKRIKVARYALEHLEPFIAGDALAPYIASLKRAQDCIGELHDIQVASETVSKKLDHNIAKSMPTLNAIFNEHEVVAWREWRTLMITLRDGAFRKSLYNCLIAASMSETIQYKSNGGSVVVAGDHSF